MVRRYEQLHRSQVDFSRHGSGVLQLVHILDGPEEMAQKGRVFACATLPPGAGVELHPHTDESETYFFLEGEGLFNDDGELVPVKKGDVAHTPAGHTHGLRNTGTSPLRYITLVLFG